MTVEVMGGGRVPDDDEPARLTGAEPHERASAIVELAQRGKRGAWPSIEPYTDDPSPLVRGAVAFARACLGKGSPDLTALIDLLASGREDDVAFAQEAFHTLGDKAVAAIVARVVAQRAGRGPLLRVLSELETEAARAALAAAARSKDRDLAARAKAVLSDE